MNVEVTITVRDIAIDPALEADLVESATLEVVLRLYTRRRISFDDARDILGLSNTGLVDLLTNRGLPLLDYRSDAHRALAKTL